MTPARAEAAKPTRPCGREGIDPVSWDAAIVLGSSGAIPQPPLRRSVSRIRRERCRKHDEWKGFSAGRRGQPCLNPAHHLEKLERPTCRQHQKANGADIAAGPTLTSAWSSLPANLPRSAWRPMSHPPTGWRPVVTGARTGIRFRLSTGLPVPGRSHFRFCPPSGDTETIPLLAAPSLNPDFACASPLIRSATRFLAEPADLLSRSPQSTALASGSRFLHAQSQRPRGQSPPRRMFEKLS